MRYRMLLGINLTATRTRILYMSVGIPNYFRL